MPRENHSEIVCIIDRSGSMESIKSDAIGGFNSFLENQKKLSGTASVTIVLFDNEYEVPVSNSDLPAVEKLTDATFVPRGSTALFDAIGRTVNEVGLRLSNTPEQERPGKVVIVILTDGQENASREFSRPTVKDMIEHQRTKYSWEFIYLAANQDAFVEAESMGISSSYTANFSADSAGIIDAYSKINESVSELRTKS